jgi:hypothetical protein
MLAMIDGAKSDAEADPWLRAPLSSPESQRSRSRRGARARRGYRGHRRPVSGSYGYRPTVGPGSQSELLTDAVEKVFLHW